MPSLPKVTIYSKDECHLCDVAKERVENARRQVPFELEIVDIEQDVKLLESYGERIPVVAVNGEEVFQYRVNERSLVRRVRRSSRRAGKEE